MGQDQDTPQNLPPSTSSGPTTISTPAAAGDDVMDDVTYETVWHLHTKQSVLLIFYRDPFM